MPPYPGPLSRAASAAAPLLDLLPVVVVAVVLLAVAVALIVSVQRRAD